MNKCNNYSGRNFALLEFREMRDLEHKILRNSRNLQSIENTLFYYTQLEFLNTPTKTLYLSSPKKTKAITDLIFFE